MAPHPAKRDVAQPMVVIMAVILFGLAACARPQPENEKTLASGRTRSPHGATTVACERCHHAAGWSPLRADMQFDHTRETAFELTGKHAQLDCGSCHLTLRFDEPRVAAGDCATCHVDVHTGRLGVNCDACHDTDSFAASGRRDAHATTSFPLTGRHRQISCEACHGAAGDQRFGPLPTECVSCHAAQYRAALPDHAGAGFPTDCAACHGSFSWSGARFEHTRETGYPLEGAHNRINCQACHVPPNFALRFAPVGPRDCISCHRADYDRVHPNLGFSDDCLSCHSLDTFRGARWAEHDARFPIYSGTHARRWTSCTQCHVGQGFATVSCLNCHEHSQARMDDKHRERPGYSYTTAACLNCHPRGEAE